MSTESKVIILILNYGRQRTKVTEKKLKRLKRKLVLKVVKFFPPILFLFKRFIAKT